MARRRTRSRTSGDPLVQRALQLASAQYGPQASTILSAIKEAGSTKTNKIRQARAAAIYNSDAEQAGAKALTAQLGQIGAAAQKNTGYLDSLMAPPAPGAAAGPGGALLAAIGNSRANVPLNVASQQAEAVKQGNERSARARSGGAFAEQAANVSFEGNVQKLRDQLSGVQNAQGLKASTTYQDLLDKANRDALDRDKFSETQRHNRETEANSAAKGGGKGSHRTANEQAAYRQKVAEALSWVRTLADDGAPGKVVHTLVARGGKTPRKKIIDPESKKPQTDKSGQIKTTEGDTVPGFGDDITRIALDLYYNTPVPGRKPGSLTKTGKRILKTQGVRAPKAWRMPSRVTWDDVRLPGPFRS